MQSYSKWTQLFLVKISEIDTTQKIISAEPGNFLDETDFDRF